MRLMMMSRWAEKVLMREIPESWYFQDDVFIFIVVKFFLLKLLLRLTKGLLNRLRIVNFLVVVNNQVTEV